MKTEIKLIRDISYDEGESAIEGIPPQKIEITVDGDAGLYDLLNTFHDFLRGMGYYPPANSTLQYVSNDAEEYCKGECNCDHDHP
jgi:hypothetical protein